MPVDQELDAGRRHAALLAAWERGHGQPGGARALTLLSAVHPGVGRSELESLSVGQRDARLLKLRRELFGRTVDAVVICGGCEQAIDLSFDIDDLVFADAPGATAVQIERGDGSLSVRVPTAGDLAAVEALGDAERTRDRLLERLIVAEADPSRLVASLTEAELEEIGAAIERADPQADIVLRAQCGSCGAATAAPVDVVAFVWAELTDWVARVLSEVHMLARAYGWREQDTLALGPARRRFYLEAVGA